MKFKRKKIERTLIRKFPLLPLPIEKAIRYINIADINHLLFPINLSKKKEGKTINIRIDNQQIFIKYFFSPMFWKRHQNKIINNKFRFTFRIDREYGTENKPRPPTCTVKSELQRRPDRARRGGERLQLTAAPILFRLGPYRKQCLIEEETPIKNCTATEISRWWVDFSNLNAKAVEV